MDNDTLIKNKLLKDNSDIEYILEYRIENDAILFKIIENKVYCPFTFEKKLTMEDFIELHPAFKSCDNLKEVLRHLNNLYKENCIILDNIGGNDQRYMHFKIFDISEEIKTKDFILNQKMTEEKDKALEDLYNIQKKQIGLFKKIKSLVGKNKKESKFGESILKDLEKKCQFKILI